MPQKKTGAKIVKRYIQESMEKRGGSNPRPKTPKPQNVKPPSQKKKKG